MQPFKQFKNRKSEKSRSLTIYKTRVIYDRLFELLLDENIDKN